MSSPLLLILLAAAVVTAVDRAGNASERRIARFRVVR